MGKKSSSIFQNKQLEGVFVPLIEKVATKYSVIINQLGDDRAEQVQYNRFINNDKVTPSRLIDHYWEKPRTSVVGKDVLVISDTSTLSFTPDKQREFIGYIGKDTKKEGFDIHPSILVDAQDGGCYGLGGMTTYRNLNPPQARVNGEKKVRATAYADKPFTENERYKWYASPEQSIKNCPGATSYTLVGDRESDIYELIAMTLEREWEFLYRCRTDRKVKGSAKKLYKTIDSWSIQYTYDLDLAATEKRTAHTATMDVKYGAVTITRPIKHPNKDLPDQITLNVIEVKEQTVTVVGNEKPVHWILLTSHPVDELSQVLKIIQWYCWRWIIEQLFRTLKMKGLNAEKAELKTFHGIINMTTIALLAAVQVIQLVQARDGETKQLISNSFTKEEQVCLKAINNKLEGKTLKQKNPHSNDTLAYGSWVIARLGGWKGYRSQGPPGPITIIRGLIRYYSILEGFYLRL